MMIPFQQGTTKGQRHGPPAAKASREPAHGFQHIGQLDTLDTDLNFGTQDSPFDKLCPKDLSRFYLQLLLAVCRLFQLA